MREIKFRGKTAVCQLATAEGCWVYGGVHSIYENDDTCYIAMNDYFKQGESKNLLVKKETLGQYTGLKDKNGVEIYEGDIIQHLYENCDKSDYYKVEWDDEELRFCFRNVGNIAAYIALEDMYSDDTGEYEFKVIGNIYDNPELLEEE